MMDEQDYRTKNPTGTDSNREDGEKLLANGKPQYKHKRKRTNGSARLQRKKTERLTRWENTGLNVGSINIAGISLLKVYMLTELHMLDVLCI
jgi:hypothetical protein